MKYIYAIQYKNGHQDCFIDTEISLDWLDENDLKIMDLEKSRIASFTDTGNYAKDMNLKTIHGQYSFAQLLGTQLKLSAI